MTEPSARAPGAIHGDDDGPDSWRIELSRELAFRANLEGMIIETNGILADMLGWSRDALRMKNFMDLVDPEDVSATREQWRRVVEGAAPTRFSVHHRCNDRSSRWVTWSAVARENTVFAVGQETTVGSANTQALYKCEAAIRRYQRAESLVRLGTGLRHEFNNLFQTIVSGLQLVERLIRADRTAECAPFIERAMRAAREAAEMNQRIAAISRPHEPSPTVVAINELVSDIVDLLRRSLPASLTLTTNLAADLWTVRCDGQHAQIALLNLVLNAYDATSGAERIVVTTANEDHDVDGEGSHSRYIAIQVTGSRHSTDVHTQGSDADETAIADQSTLESNLLMVRRFAAASGGRFRAEMGDHQSVAMVLHLPKSELPSPAATNDAPT